MYEHAEQGVERRKSGEAESSVVLSGRLPSPPYFPNLDKYLNSPIPQTVVDLESECKDGTIALAKGSGELAPSLSLAQGRKSSFGFDILFLECQLRTCNIDATVLFLYINEPVLYRYPSTKLLFHVKDAT